MLKVEGFSEGLDLHLLQVCDQRDQCKAESERSVQGESERSVQGLRSTDHAFALGAEALLPFSE